MSQILVQMYCISSLCVARIFYATVFKKGDGDTKHDTSLSSLAVVCPIAPSYVARRICTISFVSAKLKSYVLYAGKSVDCKNLLSPISAKESLRCPGWRTSDPFL